MARLASLSAVLLVAAVGTLYGAAAVVYVAVHVAVAFVVIALILTWERHRLAVSNRALASVPSKRENVR